MGWVTSPMIGSSVMRLISAWSLLHHPVQNGTSEPGPDAPPYPIL